MGGGGGEKGKRKAEAQANEVLKLGVVKADRGGDEVKGEKALSSGYGAVAKADARDFSGEKGGVEGP